MTTLRSALRPRSPAPLQILLLAITLFAFALRMFHLGTWLMWGDEGFSVFSASRDLLTITLDTTTIDPHPPLYYYLLHFYFQIAGRTELAIRFFSVFFGTATIPLAWVMGKRMYGARVGILAAGLTALAPFAVHYSQEVRMYALAIFLVTLGLYFFARLFAHDLRYHWMIYAIAMCLALYTLYHTALIFLAIGFVLLAYFKSRRVFVIRWFSVSLGIVATFLPWLVYRYASAFTGIKDVAGETQPMDFPTYLARGFAAISVGTTVPLSNAFQLAGLFAALIVGALVLALATRTAKFFDALLATLTLVPIIAYYPLYLALPLYRGRLFALACVPLMLLLARSTSLIVARIKLATPFIALLVLGTFAYSLSNYFFVYNRYSATVEDYIPAIRAIEQRAQPGDMILFHAYWQQGYFLSHYHGAPLDYGRLENQNDLNAAVSTARNVWAIVQAVPHHGAEDWLTQNAFPLGEEKFGQMRVLAYRTGTPKRGATFAEPLQFDNGMQLIGYHLNDTPIESGSGILTLQLDVQASAPIAADYTMSVRLTDARGNIIWAQADGQPSNGTQPTTTWQPAHIVRDHRTVMIPAGMPPGDYAVQVIVYDAQTGRIANVVAPENRRGRTIALGNISIRRSDAPSAPIIPNPLNVAWNEIVLAGYASLPDTLNAGDTLPLTLYWRAQQNPARDYRVLIRLRDSAGIERVMLTHSPANGWATTHWRAGETWLDKIALTIPADTTPGIAQIFIGLLDEQGNALAPNIELARVNISARTHRFDMPAPQYPIQATWENKIRLLGYDLDTKNRGVTLYWHTLQKMSERYTVFVHLLDSSGKLVAQHDREPQNGNAPTTSWLKDEIIVEAYTFTPLAPGTYSLSVGMYNTESGRRLSVDETQADHISLALFRIEP